MARAPQTLAGQLLVSHPQLRDDHFRETVVLLHTHDGAEGALGVIVNRPLGRVFGQIDSTAELKPLDDVPLFEGVELWKKLLERHRPDLRLEADSPENPGLN